MNRIWSIIRTILLILIVIVAFSVIFQNDKNSANYSFHLEYQASGWPGFIERILVMENGIVKYTYDESESLTNSKHIKKEIELNETQINELINFIVNENDFFNIPEDQDDMGCLDTPDTFVNVTYNGNSGYKWTRAGSCGGNLQYRNITLKIRSYFS